MSDNDQKPVSATRLVIPISAILVVIAGTMWITQLAAKVEEGAAKQDKLETRFDTAQSSFQTDSNRITKLETQYDQILKKIDEVNANIEKHFK